MCSHIVGVLIKSIAGDTGSMDVLTLALGLLSRSTHAWKFQATASRARQANQCRVEHTAFHKERQ